MRARARGSKTEFGCLTGYNRLYFTFFRASHREPFRDLSYSYTTNVQAKVKQSIGPIRGEIFSLAEEKGEKTFAHMKLPNIVRRSPSKKTASFFVFAAFPESKKKKKPASYE